MTETQTVTLAEHLLAWIAEDEAVAQAAIDDDGGQDGGFEDRFADLTEGRSADHPLYFTPRFGEAVARVIVSMTPRRVLAECAAKRRIVELHAVHVEQQWINPLDGPGYYEPEAACTICGWFDLAKGGCDTIGAVAQPYADRPEFREEWAL